MNPSATNPQWHSCAGCHRPVDERVGLPLKCASWLCLPCAHDVAKDVGRKRSERSQPVKALPAFL